MNMTSKSMEIKITGTPKEIAALVAELQARQDNEKNERLEFDKEDFAEGLDKKYSIECKPFSTDYTILVVDKKSDVDVETK